MKRILITLTLFFSVIAASFAQAPQKFSYQAVVRNESNTLVRGTVGVRVSILQGGVNGTVVYQETHITTTNINGLMTLQIGGGTMLSGDFATIDWADGPYFLKTETDPNGGTNYTIEGTQQLLSVPYALYAGSAANSFSGSYNDLTDLPQMPDIPTNVSAFNNDAGYITMDSVPEIPTNVSAFVNDAGYVTESTLSTENYITQNDLITNNYVTYADIPTNVSAFVNDAGYITMDSIPEFPEIPTNVSAFVNDAGYVTESTLTTENYITQNDLITNNYVTSADIPTNVSAFTNDAGYITSADVPTVPTNVSAFTNDAGYITSVPTQVNADWNATSGPAQILNKPTIPNIPTTVSSFQNDMNYVTQSVMNVTLSNYAPLSAIPTVPTNVSAFTNDANYITLSQVPTQVNADWNATAGAAQILNKPTIPNVPTNVSAFTNDAGYLTEATVQEAANIPTVVSAFENDAHYITELQLQEILNTIATMQNTIDSMNQVIEDLNNQVNPPAPEIGAVTTSPVSDITASSVVAGGNVTADGRSEITARGVCWSTAATPTIADAHTTDGSGLGEFVSNVTGLASSTTYYLCAYATNEVGTAYGEIVSFTTEESAVPIVVTNPYSDLLATSVTCGGNVLSDGGMPITDRGICWSDINPQPTIYNNVTEAGTNGTGEFIVTLTGLNAATTYYVRAYATNEMGTVYGETVTFTTIVPVLPTVTTSPVTDILPYTATFHGEVVSIGGALLSARGFCYGTSHNPTVEGTHTEDGTAGGVFESTVTTLEPTTTYYVRAYATNIVGTVYGEETSFTSSTTPPGVTTNDVSNITQTSASCGGAVTYAGGAAVTAKGLCYSTSENPTTDDNVIAGGTGTGAFSGELTGLVSNTTYYVRAYATNSVGTNYGEQKTFTTLPYLTPTIEAVEPTEVSYYSFTCGGNVTDSGTYAVTARGLCWATAPNPTISNPYIALGSGTGAFTHTFTDLTANTTYYVRAYAINSVGIAYSEQMEVTTLANTAPVVVTNSVNVFGVCQGNVTSDGGLDVTERGFCYSTYPNPTVYDNHVTSGSGSGTYTVPLSDLVDGITYYVKAYATNALGTTYGEQKSFEFYNCGTNTITDRDGNTYNTVLIGTQCWMKQNLKTTKYADGTSISQGGSTSTTTACWYYPNSNSSHKPTYGLLYNWRAVMRNSSSSSSNPSRVQGICPTGWHVPSDAEWTQLTDYVSSQSEYVCGSDNTYIAKALAGTTGWSSYTSTCAVGNTPSQNNSTGFSALPAGSYSGSYYNFGDLAFFWSATGNINDRAYYRRLNYSNAYVSRAYENNSYGYSVRCLRD